MRNTTFYNALRYMTNDRIPGLIIACRSGYCKLWPVLVTFCWLTTATAAPELINLKDIGALYEFPAPKQTATNVTFSGKYTTMEFEAGSRKFLFNKTLVWLNEPAIIKGADLAITRFDANTTIDTLLRLNQRRSVTNNITIVIDPGHGGKDTGSIGPHKACEKKIVLDLANSVKKRLEKQQISVILTRKWDSMLTRTERINIARKNKAAIFLSIHINSATNSEASGIETYIMSGAGFSSTAGNSTNKAASSGNKFDNANIQLAYCVHRQLLASTGAIDRGIRHARFDVLQDAPCPAILIECGFISNPEEELRLTKKQYRESIAEGVANGIQTLLDPSYKPAQTNQKNLVNPTGNRSNQQPATKPAPKR